jgi:hypothetical protein
MRALSGNLDLVRSIFGRLQAGHACSRTSVSRSERRPRDSL